MSKPTARIERMLSVRLQNTRRSGGGGSMVGGFAMPSSTIRGDAAAIAASPRARGDGRRLHLPPMPPVGATPRNLLACTALLAFAACGAGLITGIASNSGGGTAGEVRTPELSIGSLMPLAPAPNTTRTVVVANAQIATAAKLRVRIDAAGVGQDQGSPVAAGQGGSTAITFTLATDVIAAAVGDPTAADIGGQLSVLVDERPIAAPAPIVLARQPRAELVLPAGEARRFLSPLGERVKVRVAGLRSSDPADLQLFVATIDPTRGPEPDGSRPIVTRSCTDLLVEQQTAPGAPIVSAIVPTSSVPVQARLFVVDAAAGQSTPIDNAWYRPDIALALPSQGPTTGGSLVTLIGTALVPVDLDDTTGPPSLSFDDVELSFTKGGRTSVLAPEDFRAAESGTDRLVFTMPASPDGRPGQVDINLRVTIDGVPVSVAASRVFLFANPKPFFGPRGAVLDRTPVALAPIFLDAEPGTEAVAVPDFAVLTEQGGVGFLQLLLAQQNGMFQPFAAPRQIGNHEIAEERDPRDLCTGDFDGDQVPDMFIANAGSATAVHHLLLGRARPATPLGAVHRVAGISAARCKSALFDGDARADVLLMPGPGAPPGQVPVVLLARPTPDGPAFSTPIPLPVRPLRHDACEIADLDGDGHLDVALLRGATLQLDVAWGNGDGTFTGGQGSQLDFAIADYTPDTRSGAVGLHACRNGPQQSLGFVLAGLDPSLPEGPATPPVLGVLPQPTPRGFVAPVPLTSSLLPTQPLAESLVADLDQADPVELVVAIGGNPSVFAIAVLRFSPDGWRPVEGGVDAGAELPRQISAMHFGRAFAPTPISPEARAVFVLHESLVDGSIEKRLSTRLVLNAGIELRITPPDAGAVLGGTFDSIVGGNFHPVAVAGAGQVRDLALGRSGEIALIENDGYGGFPRPSTVMAWQGLLPHSIALLPSPAGQYDRLAFLGADGRVGVWLRSDSTTGVQSPNWLSTSLIAGLAQTAAPQLSDASRVRVADVDGDGIDDLVLLLRRVAAPVGENGAAIGLMRGKAAPTDGEFPFHQPTVLVPVHSNASAIAVADFAASASGPRRLELAVAVPRGSTEGAIDGDHVRFYRYVAGATPAGDHFERTWMPGAAQVLLAGSAPTQLAAADFDRDGRIDLLVADEVDASLRLFRNVAAPQPGQPNVDIGAFVESLSSPQPMAPGLPTALHLTDVNGDGNVDAVAVVEFQSATTQSLSTSVAFYLGSGSGELASPQFVSPMRVGDRNAHLASDIGDFNRDGVPDLLLAWPSFGTGDRNVRVLFGGTR